MGLTGKSVGKHVLRGGGLTEKKDGTLLVALAAIPMSARAPFLML